MCFNKIISKFAALAMMAAVLSVSCSKQDDGNPSGKLPALLSVSGSGIENGKTPHPMFQTAEGIWDIYAEFVGGESVTVRDSNGGSWMSISVEAGKAGVCRLRIDAASKTWSLVRIYKVSLVVPEGGDSSAKQGNKPPIVAEYKGGGAWSVKGLLVATAGLRYRFELETSDPSELKYWCAGWDNSGSAPLAHDAEYLGIRSLGQTEYDALYLKDNRACWMFPEDQVMKLADFTLSMNKAAPVQEVTCHSPHRGPVAVFIGDSITWLWKQSAYSRNKSDIIIPISPLPSYMTDNGDKVSIRFHPEFFTANNYVNVGVSGENTTEMLKRFKADVLDRDPGCVVIMGGTNDLAQGYTKDNILSNIASMAESAEKLGMYVILCSVTPCNTVYSRLSNPSTKGAHIIALNSMIKSYAASRGYVYCDYWSSIVGPDGLDMDSKYWLYDHLHPCPDCYTSVMEKIIKPLIDQTVN